MPPRVRDVKKKFVGVGELCKLSGAHGRYVRSRLPEREGAERDPNHPKRAWKISRETANELWKEWDRYQERLAQELREIKEEDLIPLTQLAVDLELDSKSLDAPISRPGIGVIKKAGRNFVTKAEHARVVAIRGKGKVGTGDAAEILGVPIQTVKTWAHRGILEHEMLGVTRWYDVEYLREFKRQMDIKNATIAATLSGKQVMKETKMTRPRISGLLKRGCVDSEVVDGDYRIYKNEISHLLKFKELLDTLDAATTKKERIRIRERIETAMSDMRIRTREKVYLRQINHKTNRILKKRNNKT